MSGQPHHLGRVGDLCSEVANWNPATLGSKGTFTYIDIGAVDQESKAIGPISPIPCEQAPSRARQLVKSGDILVSTVRPNLNAVALVPDQLDGATASTGFCVLRPKIEALDSRFLYHWVRSETFIEEMIRLATGASYPAVSDRIVKGSRIPFLSLSEQRRIAAILDKAEELRTKRRAALAKLDRLAQSIFIEMFGDPLSNPKGFPQMKLAQVSQFENGDRSSNYPSGDEVISEGVLFLSTKNLVEKKLDLAKANYISENKFQSLTRGKARNGDLLITLRGTLGSCCIFNAPDGRAFINAQMMIIRPTTKVTSSFLHALLTGSTFKRHLVSIGNGAAVQQLTATQLAELMIMVPPPDLQNEFTQKIGSVERYRGFFEESLVGTEALLTSLQHRAFRGEL